MGDETGNLELAESGVIRETPIHHGIVDDLSKHPGAWTSVTRTLSHPDTGRNCYESHDDADYFYHADSLADLPRVHDGGVGVGRSAISRAIQGLAWQ